jgi:endonuclease/exonuclease/phosphatase family metal-dependent hydrolase
MGSTFFTHARTFRRRAGLLGARLGLHRLATVGLQAGAALPAADPHQLRLLTLNLAHGRRRGTHQALVPRARLERNLHHIGTAVRAIAPDVVALQEADGPSAWSGNFDHVATLADLIQLQEFFRGEHNPLGRGRFNLASGTALLSHHPLRDPVSQRFGLSWRDTKGFVVATIAVPQWGGQEIDVASVHLDFLVRRVRRAQIRRLAETLAARSRPLVVLGDLNCCFSREPYSMELLTRKLGLHAFQPDSHSPTFPAFRPRRRLDWILISPELEFHGYGTLPARISDHLLVMADLALVG